MYYHFEIWAEISDLELLLQQKIRDLKGQKRPFKGQNSHCLWSKKMFSAKSCLLGVVILAQFWRTREKIAKNWKLAWIFGLLSYKLLRGLYNSRPKIWIDFLFFVVDSHILQNFAKITTPSRQLFALDIFWLHKERPIRPLNWPF